MALMVGSLSSCEIDDLKYFMPDSAPQHPNEEAVVWKSKAHTHDYYEATDMHLYGDMLLQGYHGNMLRFYVSAYDAETGNILYQQSDFKNPIKPQSGSYSILKDGYLVLAGGEYLATVEAQSGEILWEAHLPGSSGEIVVIGDFVYRTDQFSGSSSLHRYHIQSGLHEKILTLTTQDHGKGMVQPNLLLPVRYLNSANEECFVIGNNGYHPGNGDYYFEVLAYNHVTHDIIWTNYYGLDRVHNMIPIMDQDRVYIGARNNVYCIQAQSGSLLWKHHLDKSLYFNFGNTQMMLYQGSLLSMSDGYLTVSLNAISGQVIWSRNDGPPGNARLHLNNDKIWYGYNGINAISPHNGESILSKYQAPHSEGFWYYSVISHPTQNRIYTYDRHRVYCLDVNKMVSE